jgi:hypothetical protein
MEFTRVEQCSWSRVHKLDSSFLRSNSNKMTFSILRRYHIEVKLIIVSLMSSSLPPMDKNTPCEYAPINGTQYVPESIVLINDPSR